MDFNEVYQKERATRKFTNRKVNENVLRQIIKEAQHFPSLLNSQPWKVYAVMGDQLDKLRKEYRAKVEEGAEPNEDFATMLSLEWDIFPSQNMATMGASQSYFFNKKLDLFNEANNSMFNAPVVVYLTIPMQSPAWSVFDLGIFAQSLMLIALNRGIATMPAHSLVSYPDLVRKYASIPEDEMVGMAIGLGYPDKTAEVNDPKYFPDRLPLDGIYKLSK
ncbi:nitroreductase [Lactobacillus gigeriorum]|uniref:Nitroreductase n=1 Tax=Lactobacillus gigeriorum DSM 23908 = CRBIP 24.85 TaxID=1423751 RepID=I7K1J1_9LACO|nr:nitroreductase [Lactobacillus gigeriorum]KRN11776.1 nitroreductase [Lactobacillus gigeriorum DSM 23908 = CRBIP 24.85]CCI87475.1 Nitroreductase [Lactobacillus gigeriorum DSM 23908 = CRBIP 24.85]